MVTAVIHTPLTKLPSTDDDSFVSTRVHTIDAQCKTFPLLLLIPLPLSDHDGGL